MLPCTKCNKNGCKGSFIYHDDAGCRHCKCNTSQSMIMGSNPFLWPTFTEILIAIIESPTKIKKSCIALASKYLSPNQTNVDRKNAKIEFTMFSILTFSSFLIAAFAGYLLDKLLWAAYALLGSAAFVSLGITKASDKRQRAIIVLRKEFQDKIDALNKKSQLRG